MSLFFVSALASIAFVSPTDAHADEPGKPAFREAGWEKLGERTVDAKVDRDTIAVGKDDGAFTAIQMKVEGSSLVMFDVKVTFGNGETFEPKTRLVFEQGTTSRVIDLPGEKRGIKKVEFRYANLPGGGKARVELHGKAAPDPWSTLGERTVDGKIDRDTIQVGKEDGRFKAIKLEVDNSAIVLFDIKVTFGNGETFEPKTRLVFEKGATSRVIDLPGEKRGIKKIELRYANLPGGGRARVQVHGR